MKKFYTDGVKTIKIDENQIPPEGFRLGRTFAVNPWNKQNNLNFRIIYPNNLIIDK